MLTSKQREATTGEPMATNETTTPEHPHPHAGNPHAPPGFDFEKFATFCARGFAYGVGKADGQVCIEAAISLCSGEGLGDKPTCVHPAIRAHSIRLNDARWSSPEARAKGTCDYGLAQLGTAQIDGVAFARRLAFLTITKLLPVVLRLVTSLDPSVAEACEKSVDLVSAQATARAAQKECRKIAAVAAAYAYADDAADAADAAAYAVAVAAAYAADAYAADAAAYAAAAYAAAAADAAAYAARDRILTQAAALATQAIEDVRAGMVQP
jgi:hypothetical protein